mgnify:CR=1 FL=1
MKRSLPSCDASCEIAQATKDSVVFFGLRSIAKGDRAKNADFSRPHPDSEPTTQVISEGGLAPEAQGLGSQRLPVLPSVFREGEAPAEPLLGRTPRNIRERLGRSLAFPVTRREATHVSCPKGVPQAQALTTPTSPGRRRNKCSPCLRFEQAASRRVRKSRHLRRLTERRTRD